jgi:homoprotocatechuate degradation regulator HpaR
MTDTAAPAADLRPFTRSLPMALLRAREAAMRRFRPHLATHGLTEQRWRVLRALNAAGSPLDVGEVADRTFLLAPSLSRILTDLDGLGLVDRVADAGDRRRALLSLTDGGRRLVAVVAPESEAIYGQIEERFGADRLDALLTDLRDLEEALGEEILSGETLNEEKGTPA